MNIENLKQIYEQSLINEYGEHILTVKNYKEMCKILEEKEKDGNSKTAQIKEWNRYFDFSRDNQKYIIKEIYDKPFPKNIYISPLDTLNELLICEKIIDHMENPKYEDKRYVVSMTELAYDLGYVNEIFKQGYEHPNQLIKEIFDEPEVSKRSISAAQDLTKYDIGNKYILSQLNKNVVYDCYNIIPRRYRDRITKTLHRLEQQCIINISIINFGMFIEPDESSPTIVVNRNSYGDEQIDYKYRSKKVFRELTDEEDNLVQQIRNNILISLECKDIHELYKNNKVDEFNHKFQIELLKYGIASVKKCYALAFAKDYIYKKRDDIRERQRELNKLFLDKSLKNSYTMRESRLKRAQNDPNINNKDKSKLKKYYTKEQEKRDKVLKYLLSI